MTRSVLQQIRQARGRKPSQYLPLGKPRYARPERARGLKSVLGGLAGPLVGDERFWRNLNSIRFDSRAEKQLVRWLALSGAQLTGVSWGRLGCSLPVIDGSNGRDAGCKAQPTFLLQDGVPWHGDKVAEAFRDADLGVPVLHLDAAEVGRPGTLRSILDWARQQG